MLLGNYSASGSWKRVSPKSDFWQVVKDAGGVDIFTSRKHLNISAETILNQKTALITGYPRLIIGLFWMQKKNPIF